MKKEKKRLLPGAALAALAAAALIYLIMLNIEKNMMGAYEKGTVYTAKEDMGHGVELDENSIETKLAAVEMPVELIPAAAIRTKEALEGYDLPELRYFMATFLEFSLSLDQLK